jgi:mycofactocin system glycosyltransferase
MERSIVIASGARFRLDSSWWRHRTSSPDGAHDTVVGGSPLRLFRLGAAGSRLADVLESDGSVPAGAESLADRFEAAGVIHPIVEPDPAPAFDRVTVVIPTHGERHVELASMVAELRRQGFDEIVVVDDGTRFSLAPIEGALVVRRDAAGGPAAARNTGASTSTRDVLLFLDADVRATPGFFSTLWPHFDDERTAVVAPRVMSSPGPGLVAAYEVDSSPLDLGDEPARVRPNTRVSYVPAAALAVRRSVFDEIGGFDESLRFGEDVDLVWRVAATERVVRYEPSSIVRHAPRSSVGALARQRFGYGSAAADLEARHPGAVRPLRINRWSAIGWSLVGLGHPFVGLAVGAGSTAALADKMRSAPDRWVVAGRLAGLGNLHAGRLVASAITRTWWPIAVVSSLVSKRARRVLLVSAVVPNLWRWVRRKPEIDPLRYVALRVIDDASYGAGVWNGARRNGRWEAITPRFD